jgi:hypothetical protein
MSQETQSLMPVAVTTRLDPDVAEELAQLCQREKRSLSAQLALIVESYLEQAKLDKAA